MYERIAIGSAQFGLRYGIANPAGKVSESEAKGILQLANKVGIRALDTAIAYGDSEQMLGTLGVSGWEVTTKLPVMPDDVIHSIDWVESTVKSSLQRLKISALDGLLLHRPSQLLTTAGPDIYSALCRLKQLGLVRRIGISIYDVAELDALIPYFNFDIIQAPLNILDVRLPRSGWIERLTEKGTALHVRSAFLQGLLLMKPDQRPTWFTQWQPLWDKWNSWLDQHDITPLQACLRYVMSLAGIGQVIVGIDSVTQLQQILDAVGGDIPEGYNAFQTDDARLLNPALWKL